MMLPPHPWSKTKGVLVVLVVFGIPIAMALTALFWLFSRMCQGPSET